ncbi:DUF3298 and DUF4163 domain-containing protein [Wukongibacter baidiensis]|uniref:DUF3298 and DUF4163 domain-containing protein n=1 Tax=Wukongibacter baidiensis TaxID=1723361 RepID=UPI003D7F314A
MKKVIIACTILSMITACSAKPVIEKDSSPEVTIEKEETTKEEIAKEETLLDKYKKIQPIIVKTKVEEEISENVYEWKINRPGFEGIEEKRALELINKEINEDIDKYIERMSYIKEVEEGEERVSAYSFFIETDVATNQNGILSIGLDMYEYTGGAHGNYWTQFYNFDLLEGKEIELKDFFEEDVDYLELIYKNIFEQIKNNEYWTKNLQEYYYKDKEPLIFFIQDGMIKIYFAAYGLGSYADGEQIFEIKMEAVEGKLSEFGEIIYSIPTS